MEQLDYNLLYRWFVGLGVDEAVWVPTVFTKNRDRLLEADVARQRPRPSSWISNELRGLLSDEHFSVDGTQIAAWAPSMKSFQGGRTGSDDPPAALGPGNGERRLSRREARQHHARLDQHGSRGAAFIARDGGKEAKL